MKSYRKLQVLMFYRLGKKMRKPYGGGGWGPPQTKIGSQKKKNQHWNRVIKDSGLFAFDQK